MRIAVLTLMVGLTGCGALPDDKICTAIYPAPGNGTPAALERARDLPWQRQRVEACLHREAYKLARADADILSITNATIERCQPAFAITVELAGNVEERRQLAERETMEIAVAANGVISQWERERLTRMTSAWVVEGRAGNCRG
jgi:hypothetical protein